MRAPIQAIAFDLWNTLIGCLHPVNPMNRLVEAVREAGVPDPFGAISEHTMRSPLPDIAAALRELERRLGKVLARGGARSRLLSLWEETSGQNVVFDDVAAALSRLRRRFRVGVISNTQSFDLEFWRGSAARACVEVELLSCDAGLLKPDPRLFRRFAEEIGIEAAAILMVGDTLRDDVEGARAAGFQAVRIARPIATLSHREPPRDDSPVAGLKDLERRLEALGAGDAGPEKLSRSGGRAGAARPRAVPRRARATRRRRR